jgi:hypothetical protein
MLIVRVYPGTEEEGSISGIKATSREEQLVRGFGGYWNHFLSYLDTVPITVLTFL